MLQAEWEGCAQQGAKAELVTLACTGAKMCPTIWEHSRVSLCLPKSCKHTITYPRTKMFFTIVWSTRSCQRNHPHLLWKASGQPDFYNPASANYSLLVYWPKDTRPLWQWCLMVGGGSKTQPPQDKTGRIAVGLWLQLIKIVWQDDCNSREETNRGLWVQKVRESHLL